MTPAEAAAEILALLGDRPPTLGRNRLVCIDGPAGSGKTTTAEALTGLLSESLVVHMDDLYPGWEGLHASQDQVLGLLGPLAEGRPGRYRRYDWEQGRLAEWQQVAPGRDLILEGVGSGCRAWAALIGVLVWVEAPPELRLARGLDRDGPADADRWPEWMAQEDALFAEERTAERADLRVASGR